MSEIIKTENLQYAYPVEEGQLAVPVLKGVNLSIQRGEFVAVLGHNGSGKSTLAGCFNAIRLPTGGVCYVDMMDTRDENNTYEVRKTVSMVFQNPDNQLVATVVEEDVAFALENMGVPPAEIRKRVDEALKAVGMYEYRTQAPHRLSGGQKQRVAIARMLLQDTPVLIFDDSLSAVDAETDAAIRDALHSRRHGTMFLISHRIATIRKSDLILVLDKGRVVQMGTHDTLAAQEGLYRRVCAIQNELPQAASPKGGEA